MARRSRGGAGTAEDRPAYRKKWGQHHLVDPALCDPLIRFLEPRGRPVLEIGPGAGALTGRLAEAGGRVVACEVDLAWLFRVARGPLAARVRWVGIDARRLAWERVPRGTRVAGNLPFNVATPILLDLLPRGDRVDRAGFMVQKEVADRLTAAPGSRDWGALGAWVRAWAEVTALGVVRPGAFRPPPKVAGTFVGLVFRDELPLERSEMEGLGTVIRASFAQRRKTLRNSLGALLGRAGAAAAIEAAGLDPGSRAEELTLDDFVRLRRVVPTDSISR